MKYTARVANCRKSQATANESNGRKFRTRYARVIDPEYARANLANEWTAGRKAKTVPLAANPMTARLTTRNAKLWNCWIAKRRVRVTSKASALAEIRTSPVVVRGGEGSGIAVILRERL